MKPVMILRALLLLVMVRGAIHNIVRDAIEGMCFTSQAKFKFDLTPVNNLNSVKHNATDPKGFAYSHRDRSHQKRR